MVLLDICLNLFEQSLFQLVYRVRLRDVNKTKEFLDTLRCRNGNLDIICTLPAYGKEEL